MKRISAGTCVALLVLGLSAFLTSTSASAAPAQADPDVCFPSGPDVDYPPTGPLVDIDPNLALGVEAFFNPGATGEVTVTGAIPGETYCGILYSTPVVLPLKQANAQGNITYGLAVPKDFELAAVHHIDLFKAQVQVGAFDFCVDKAGKLAPDSACAKGTMKPGGNLAKTGTNHLLDLLRMALILVAVGATVLYARRRVQQRRATAAA